MRNKSGTWEYKRSQTEALLHHFNHVETRITPLAASKVYGIERLAGRIFDLKNLGHQFETNFKKDALGKRYVEYVYLGWEPAPNHFGIDLVAVDVGGGF